MRQPSTAPQIGQSRMSLNLVRVAPFDRGTVGLESNTRFGKEIERRDAALFVGRTEELRLLNLFLELDSSYRVALVHGEGGIGKSSLLREVRRHAQRRDYRVRWIDSRAVDPERDDLRQAIAELRNDEKRLLFLDTFERLAGFSGELRRLAWDLPVNSRLVIADRRPPRSDWVTEGWENRLLPVKLEPLPRHDAIELMRRRGVQRVEADPVLEWARGEPLALCLVAEILQRNLEFGPEDLNSHDRIAHTLISRLASPDLSSDDRDVLAMASLSRGVDTPMVAAVLPGVDPAPALARLRSHGWTEGIDRRIVVQDRLREAVQTALRNEDPGHDRELRRRLANHLHDRALSGDHRFVTELAELAENPRLRWGLGLESSAHYHADEIRPEDEAAVEAAVAPVQPRRWALLRRWLRTSPQHVVAVRDVAGDLAGVGIYVTPRDAPPWSDEDPVMGPWLAHARRHVTDGRAVLSRAGVPLKWVPDKAAIANSVILARRGVEAQRFYGHGYSHNPTQIAFLEAMGYQRVPSLDVDDGELAVNAYVLDVGEKGVVGTILDLVRRDLGFMPSSQADARQIVRNALRNFHDDATLAATPFATGSNTVERAESARRLLRTAAEASFGETDDERLLRTTVVHGYLERSASHEETARSLHLARSSYFRRLAGAVDRIATYLTLNGSLPQSTVR